ncbi:hypothetical protein [Stackebrandtia nassauensis]|uniref:Resolvase helix-turn-helix domain protein n=1 Tax=Stackebrandtia nassauensis (strain DSM 44728 / CIP 108903 / NRRL B-16338 / NBRC 102104 / LLR-40K-21) TaxID=446470 RepID=D3PU51_STANL|nr:hypothetical protein [Stackebrandtia nassauensis]ADD40997.1 hypothetical protein Snas_1288 [Stackebrandtia nassauensis DSM 44728]
MQYQDPRAAEARRLRTEEGLSRQQIRDKLRVGNNNLDAWLKNVPPPEWTKRPNAKDRLRDMARQMRAEGRTYDEIVEALKVSKSSVSLWTRDVSTDNVPAPGWSPRARAIRSEVAARRQEARRAACKKQQAQLSAEVGPFDAKVTLVSGAIAYWCEGAKVKPWRSTTPNVTFTNTDPRLLRLFLRFLEIVPISYGSLAFRIDIHESADDEKAKAFWCRELRISIDDFMPTLWKKHNPKTVRKNVGSNYHGCLVIRVRKSADLYWYIENLAIAAMAGMSDASADWGTVA